MRRHPIVFACTSALGLLMLGGAGTCGILFDLWSWDEVTERAVSARVEVEEGALEIVGYDRTNIWIQRHVYAFEGSLGTADYYVEEAVFNVVFDCDGPATCFADHWLEVPLAIPIEVRLDAGLVQLFALSGPLDLTIGDGVTVQAEGIASLDFAIAGGEVGDVTLRQLIAPQRLAIDLAAGTVALELPPGTYACDVAADGGVDIAPEIVCDPAATSIVHVHAGDGSVTITAAASG